MKTWNKPIFTIVCKSTIDENVLAHCKHGHGNGDPPNDKIYHCFVPKGQGWCPSEKHEVS